MNEQEQVIEYISSAITNNTSFIFCRAAPLPEPLPAYRCRCDRRRNRPPLFQRAPEASARRSSAGSPGAFRPQPAEARAHGAP